jgi:hypothetical protein
MSSRVRGGKRGGQRVEIHGETAALADKGNLPRPRPKHLHDGRAVGPVGAEYQGFVAVVDDAADGDIQRLHARRGDQHLPRRVQVYLMKLGVFGGDGGAQAGQSRVFGVKGVAVDDGPVHCGHNVIRRGQIGFAKMETEYTFHTKGHICQLADAGGLHTGQAGSQRGAAHWVTARSATAMASHSCARLAWDSGWLARRYQ